jgi:serine/threonine protein kinase
MLSSIKKEDFEFEKTRKGHLGKGSFGEVALATHRPSGTKVALKKIEKQSLKSTKMKQTLLREIQIQKQLNHQYICRLYSSFEDSQTIYLALEYASVGNLFFLIRKEKNLTEEFAFKFFI